MERANFRDNHLCRLPSYPWNGIEQLYHRLERAAVRLNLLIEPGNRFIEVIELTQ
jgi:hypothetical protein